MTKSLIAEMAKLLQKAHDKKWGDFRTTRAMLDLCSRAVGEYPETASLKLTPKQKLFIEEYLKDFNMTQAAIRAGYSKKSAHVIGQENLRKPAIQHYLRNAIRSRVFRRKVEQEDIVRELMLLASSDMTDFADWDGQTVVLKNSKKLPPGLSSCVQEVSSTKDGARIKLYGRDNALRLLGQHLGMFLERLSLEDIELKIQLPEGMPGCEA